MYIRFIALIFFFCSVGVAHATGMGSLPAINSIILDEDIFLCSEINGLLWCRFKDESPEAEGANCNQVCALKGLIPIADDTAWLEAQNTIPECEAIRDGVGLIGYQISLGNFAYGCSEFNTSNIRFYCSINAGCPSLHRTNSNGEYFYSVCPCE